jgi:transposase
MNKYSKPDLSNITMISLDELSTHKDLKYVTLVIDAVTGRPLFVGDGKGEAALEPFWEALGPRRRKRIQAVAIDMGKAFISAVKKNLPHANLVFDHFHVVKLVNDTLNKLRIEVLKSATLEEKKPSQELSTYFCATTRTFPQMTRRPGGSRRFVN